jgi:hypothetical protein
VEGKKEMIKKMNVRTREKILLETKKNAIAAKLCGRFLLPSFGRVQAAAFCSLSSPQKIKIKIKIAAFSRFFPLPYQWLG